MFKGSKLYSIFTGKCPKCHKGKLFLNANPYKFKNWDKMHSDCSHCSLHYELEPGFFQGAMYVSYGLGVGLGVAIFFAFLFTVGFDPLWFIIINTLMLILTAPLLFRMARAIYLNIFIKYNKQTANH